MDFQRWWANEGHRLWRDEKLLASEVARAAWEAATKAEREACAKIVDVPAGAEAWEIRGGEEGIELLRDMAAAIRAR
jgi:hypothetical protein